MIAEEFSRTALLLGQEALEHLARSRVAVFGIGGVGSYVAEALARSGVGELRLVDNDTVSLSNINRQLIATHDTLGSLKVEVMKQRILAINPAAHVLTYPVFYLPEEHQGIIDGCDYVVDAIDTIAGKIALVSEANSKKIPIISSMGAGNKLDPTRFEVTDLYQTSVCPLCRVMRRELRRLNIPQLKVVYSTEPPISPKAYGEAQEPASAKRQIPGSVAFVPSVAGLILAGEVIKDLCHEELDANEAR